MIYFNPLLYIHTLINIYIYIYIYIYINLRSSLVTTVCLFYDGTPLSVDIFNELSAGFTVFISGIDLLVILSAILFSVKLPTTSVTFSNGF